MFDSSLFKLASRSTLPVKQSHPRACFTAKFEGDGGVASNTLITVATVMRRVGCLRNHTVGCLRNHTVSKTGLGITLTQTTESATALSPFTVRLSYLPFKIRKAPT